MEKLGAGHSRSPLMVARREGTNNVGQNVGHTVCMPVSRVLLKLPTDDVVGVPGGVRQPGRIGEQRVSLSFDLLLD